MRGKCKWGLVIAVLLAVSTLSFAQGGAPAAPQAPAATASASGFRAEFLNELNGVEKHIVGLAEAMPADKYTWRPGEGVRSVSEVYLHIAAANYSLPRRLGTPPPAGFTPMGFDKSTTDKAKVVDTLKDSFAHLRKAALNLSDADLEKKTPWFGGSEVTYRGVLLFVVRHMSEHLGQSIAYARMNGVVPPWSEEQPRQQPKPPEKPKQ